MNIEKAGRYLRLAKEMALFSKDLSTKVGAIVVGPNHEIRSSGLDGRHITVRPGAVRQMRMSAV